MIDYVSLHNHTHFSLLDALSSPKDLFTRAKELGQTAIAITDHGSLACAWDAFKAAKEVGIKYIAGVELYFVNDVNHKDERIRHIVLLAKNAIGYRNVLTLNRLGFDHSSSYGKKLYPIIDWNLLEKYSDGIICLTSCANGILSQLLNNKKFTEAEDAAKRLVKIFGDNLGVEIQSHNLKRFSNGYHDSIDQDFTNGHLIRLAQKLNIRIVPTTNSHYINKEDAETHDVFLAIGSGQPQRSNARIKYDTPNFYVKSGDEVREFFARKYEESVDSWIANSIYFANLCEEPAWVDPKFSNKSGKELPEFPCKDEKDYDNYLAWLNDQSDKIKLLEEDKSFLRYRCDIAFKSLVPEGQENIYNERLEEEFGVLEYHGFSSYMLIVADFLAWARTNNIRVGVGRGSVAGSLVAYLTKIHLADPIKYKLVFARFHNMEKKSFPDVDNDLASSGRDRVKAYVKNKYGEDNFAHVSNINTVTPKVFARDIARACELGGSQETGVEIGTDVANAIMASSKNVEKAMEESGLFCEYTKRYPQFQKYSEICGKYRAWATHAGGVIISKRPLTGLVPLRKDKDGNVAVEYDKDRAEENGLVKIDMLGASTLDIIDSTIELIIAAGKTPPTEPFNFDIKDQKTYDLISRGDTFGVFQLGTSSGTIDLCKKIKPKSIEDISTINALCRPSARDIRADYIDTMEGRKPFNLIHPSLQRAFGSTFGFGLYEECLLYLAQDVAGWDLQKSDRLRKLTKDKGKHPEKIAQWKKDFISDAFENNKISNTIATKIWDEVVDKFQGYGFNLSHSTLYSMTGYMTAYYKANFPVEFLLANLKAEIDANTVKSPDKISKIKSEIKKAQVNILPPNLNDSELSYSLKDSKTLITGLDALKFVGNDAIKDIIAKRPFKSFFDFMVRCNSSVRSNTIQALAVTGCLDNFDLSRKQIFLYCSDYRKKLQSWLKKHNPNLEEFIYPWPATSDKDKEWSLPELYALEKKYLGESFICGKQEAYGKFFNDPTSIKIKSFKNEVDKMTVPSIKVEVKSVFEFQVKKNKSKFLGQEMAKAVVEDINGDQCSLTIFPDQYKMVKERLKQLNSKAKFEEGIAIHFSGTTNFYEDEMGLLLNNFYNFSPVPALPVDKKARKVSLKVAKKANNDISEPNAKTDDKEDFTNSIEEEMFDEGYIEEDDGSWDD